MRRVLPHCEANTAPIRSVVLHHVACEFVVHKGAQTQVEANTQIILVKNRAVATTKRMNYTAAAVIIRQKPTRTILSMMNLASLPCCALL
jgi:hypothetical protein